MYSAKRTSFYDYLCRERQRRGLEIIMNELVSIIIPSYNRQETIIRAVESVLHQTYPKIEVIVVDDCSSDNTVFILKEKYQNDNRVIIERLPENKGACFARNRGIELSKGEYIAFLDSDDEFYSDKIDKQVNAIRDTQSDLCASDYVRIDQRGIKSKIVVKKCSSQELYDELLFCNFITTGTLIGKRCCFVKMRFDESLPRYQDWDLVLKLCLKYKFCFLNEDTLLQKYQQNSITSSTSHKKTFDAMGIIFEKNRNGFKNNRRAMTQFQWLMGYHSMFIKGEENYKLLWSGVVGDGFKIKRLLILVMFSLGLQSKIESFFIQ